MIQSASSNIYNKTITNIVLLKPLECGVYIIHLHHFNLGAHSLLIAEVQKFLRLLHATYETSCDDLPPCVSTEHQTTTK